MESNLSLIDIFLIFIKKYPKEFFFLFLILVLEGLIAALSVLSVIPLADFMMDSRIVNPSQVTRKLLDLFNHFNFKITFWNLASIFLITNLLKGLFEILIKYSILKIKYSVIKGLFGETLETFFKAKWGFFSGNSQGKLLNTLNREMNTIGDTLGHIATLFAQIVQIAIYLAVPFMLNFKLTFTALSLAIFFGIPFLLLYKKSYKLGLKNTESANSAMGILSEIMGAAKLIIGFGNQVKSKNKFIEAFDLHSQITLKSQTLSTAVPKLFQPLSLLAVVISVGLFIENNFVFSELAAVMWSLLGAMPLLSSVLQGNISLGNFMPSYEQLILLENEAKLLAEPKGIDIYAGFKRFIELNEVSFSYVGRPNVLKNINLKIIKGKMTALVGESGSGKSTITDLLIGLQTPSNGDIRIDDKNLNLIELNSFRNKIGYVPQDPQLFNSTIRENLLWANSCAKDSDIWESLELANAKAFVRDLPQGLDSIVGDRGLRLSGGQRQRIALARALIKKPDLLILDEATSSLDSESEIMIQRSIENIAKETTILVIAHRLSTIINSDFIYVLKKGVIIESGEFKILVKKDNGVLNKLIASQAFKIN
jgi:ABC-type multidrug transport system fused ATPase/permease subunit